MSSSLPIRPWPQSLPLTCGMRIHLWSLKMCASIESFSLNVNALVKCPSNLCLSGLLDHPTSWASSCSIALFVIMHHKTKWGCYSFVLVTWANFGGVRIDGQKLLPIVYSGGAIDYKVGFSKVLDAGCAPAKLHCGTWFETLEHRGSSWLLLD